MFRRPIVARLLYGFLFAVLVVVFGYVNRHQWTEGKVSSVVYAGLAVGVVGVAAGIIRLWLDLKDPVRRNHLLGEVNGPNSEQRSESTQRESERRLNKLGSTKD
jgi:hypothetical protein